MPMSARSMAGGTTANSKMAIGRRNDQEDIGVTPRKWKEGVDMDGYNKAGSSGQRLRGQCAWPGTMRPMCLARDNEVSGQFADDEADVPCRVQ